MKRTSLLPRLARALLCLLALPAAVWGYDLYGVAWKNGDIPLQLQLGVPPTRPIDGTTDWNDVASAALDRWNAVLVRSRLVGVKNSSVAKADKNGFTNVFFDTAVYGTPFGERVLAITAVRARGLNITEADVIVNSAETWDSYRGNLQSPRAELQRVLTHEFGHALGLGHPDKADPPQTVAAIMNSTMSNTEALQDDDRAGLNELYGHALAVPTNGVSLPDKTLNAGAPLDLVATSTGADLTYTWAFTPPGGAIRSLLNGDGNPWPDDHFKLFSVQPSDAGTYSVAATNFAGMGPIASAVVTVNPVHTANALLVNLSARGRAGAGDDTFIVGFVVTGSTPKPVLVRAIGPTLATQGVNGPLADPKLKLYRMSGGTSSLLGENDNWASVTDAAAVRAAASRVGAFGLADNSKDAALLVVLQPGVYSALVDSQGGAPGIALLEVYDADASQTDSLAHKLVNVSTRSYVGTGEEKLFGGFVVSGPQPKQVLIRATGPGLTAKGVNGANTDPNLLIFKDGVQIADNDDWAYSNQTDILRSTASLLGASPLDEGSYDCALLITLPPGVYSAVVAGRHDETGVVLLEVYEVPE